MRASRTSTSVGERFEEGNEAKIGNNSERQHEIDFIPTRMQQQAFKALIKRAMLRTNSTGMVGRQ